MLATAKLPRFRALSIAVVLVAVVMARPAEAAAMADTSVPSTVRPPARAALTSDAVIPRRGRALIVSGSVVGAAAVMWGIWGIAEAGSRIIDGATGEERGPDMLAVVSLLGNAVIAAAVATPLLVIGGLREHRYRKWSQKSAGVVVPFVRRASALAVRPGAESRPFAIELGLAWHHRF